MTSAVEKYAARADSTAAAPQFSLLLAKLAILAAGNQNYAEHESSSAADREMAPAVDAAQLVRLRTEMTGPCFSSFLHCYLLDVEFHLEEIARARRANDFPRLARKADILAGAAADIGALHTSAAAQGLGEACRAGNYRQTSQLIGALNRSCIETEMELRGFLGAHAWPPGPV